MVRSKPVPLSPAGDDEAGAGAGVCGWRSGLAVPFSPEASLRESAPSSDPGTLEALVLLFGSSLAPVNPDGMRTLAGCPSMTTPRCESP